LIIYFGGNGECSANVLRDILSKNRATTSILVFDYPEYGNSEGEISESSIYDMAEASITYSLKKWSSEKICIVGYSLGTGVATYVTSKFQFMKSVLIAPYKNMTAVFNSHLPVFYGPFKNLVKYDFPSIDYCSTMEANVLIIASDTDEVIPYSMAIEFKEQLNQKAELITISGLSHCVFRLNGTA